MTSFLTGALGDYLGDAVAAAVGIEHTDAEFSERAEAAFKRADADGSGALDFGETYAACRAVPGLKHLSEARAREIFKRFDEDDSGSLDANEFGKLAALLRSAHALDQMPGVIYCGGRLMNPSRNPAAARAARLRELYSKPYRPRSVLARAVARPTTRRRVVYGGVDLDHLEALTDDDETRAETSAGAASRSARRSKTKRRGSRRARPQPWSVGALETLYGALLVFRLACAVLGTAYVHPDEYHQTVEISARDVLGVAAAPRAWEFDAAGAPTRSAVGHVLAAGASFRVWRFLARFDRNVKHVARAMLAAAAGGCERAALARGVAAGLREAAARVGGGAEDFAEAFADSAADARVSPAVLFLAPRVFAFCGSLVVDLAAARAARAAYWARSPARRNASRDARRVRGEKSFSGAARAGLRARLFVASSWPAVTLLVRPFTNAVECVLISTLICLVCATTPCDSPSGDEDDSVDGGSARATEEASEAKKDAARRTRRRLRAATRATCVVGAVTAVGTWTRFTFPMFAAPLGFVMVARAARVTGRTGPNRASARARGAAAACAAGGLGFAAVACLLVVVDTAYFQGGDAVARVFLGELHGEPNPFRNLLETSLVSARAFANDFVATAEAWFRDPRLPPLDAFSAAWRESSVVVAATRGAAARFAARCAAAPWVVTPYNAFAYNADAANLAAHGLHPKITHALLNFPVLFGLMAFFGYRAALRAVAGAFAAFAGRKEKDAKKTSSRVSVFVTHENDAVASANATRAALLCVLVLPLLCLSLAPHQEPRFLLPALPAAAALAASEPAAAALLSSSPAALFAFSATNLLGACFFGFAHQSGVVPAVAQMASILAEDDTAAHALVYFWRTYTPPESLLAFPADSARRRRTEGSVSPSHIVDLQGASMDGVLAAFAANEDWSHFYVVAPATAAAELRARLAERGEGVAVSETWRRGAHFSGEELRGYRDALARGGLSALWRAMSIGVYVVER